MMDDRITLTLSFSVNIQEMVDVTVGEIYDTIGEAFNCTMEGLRWIDLSDKQRDILTRAVLKKMAKSL